MVGSGKMAQGFLGLLMKHKKPLNLEVVGIYSRSEDRAEALAAKADSKVIQLSDMARKSDLIFIMTNDQAIGQVAEQIADCIIDSNTDNKEKKLTAVHFSGALTSSVLSPLQDKGMLIASLHPLQSLAGIQDAISALEGSWYTFEGDKQAEPILKDLVLTIGGRFITIEPEQKTLYHAAACVVSNYLTTLIQIGIDIFQEAGLPKEISGQALLPLVRGTVSNIEKIGPHKALTGPISRGDWQTVESHLVKMEQENSPYIDIYRLLGKHTARMAFNQGTIHREQWQLLDIKVLAGGTHHEGDKKN